MSNIYISEPQTKGKVILRTTVGDMDFELWSKECPKTCRNFVQLCMEGYFDNTMFHRIIKGFIVQTGDPTGTGFGGESVYGGPWPQEFHSRIRFSHRGLLAMATSIDEGENNGSQFFITLDKCGELAGKHTIFGKITGDTIFNVLKLNDFEVDDADRPKFPPKILKTEVVWNPFDDIVPRQKDKSGDNKSKKKVQKNFSLLSFGEEAEQEEKELEVEATTMKSSYHFSDNQLERETAAEVERRKLEEKSRKKQPTNTNHGSAQPTEEESKKATKEALKKAATGASKSEESSKDFAEKMRSKVLSAKRKAEQRETDQGSDQDEEVKKDSTASIQEARLQAIRDEQKRLKMEIMGIKQKQPEEQQSDASLLEEQRAKYLNKRRGKRKGAIVDEAKILEKLESFRTSLHGNSMSTEETSKVESSNEDKGEEEYEEERDPDDDLSEGNSAMFRSHVLKFAKEKKVRDPMQRKDDDEYTVIDPLHLKNVPPVSQHQRRLLAQKKLDQW